MDPLVVICPVLYVLCLVLLGVYIAYVYRKHGYVVSLFNVGLFQWYACIVLSPWYYFVDESWNSLHIQGEAVALVKPYLLQSMLINYAGTAIFMVTLLVCAWRMSERFSSVALVRRVANGIDSRLVFVFVVLAAAVFTFICFRYNGTFPLLNAKRAFYLDKPFSPVYLLASQLMSTLGLYEGLRWVARKGWVSFAAFLLCSICLVLTGNRGSALLQLFLPVVLYWLYVRGIKKKGLAGLKRQTLAVLVAIAITAVLGLVMQSVRGGRGFGNVQAYATETLNGNTFCDVRDGAYLLMGFENRMNSEFLLGKTYAAGLISFVPSSMSPYRQEWSWGRFTTQKLSRWKHHFGFRGGNYLESYLNFGVVGVVIVAVVSAVVLAWQEEMFRRVFLFGWESVQGGEILVCSLVGQLSGFLVSSSGAYNGYVILGITVLLYFLSKLTFRIQRQKSS
ncbi:MAG: hypothetical protein IKF78_01560 [Atopobiaceae bacterium]|nr:hypothetical protein [Atopobiaceae bacterium]